MGLRDLWERRDVSLGGWLESGSHYLAEQVGRVGFDWLALDMQHGLVSFDRMVSCLQALAAAGAPTIVRVPFNEPGDIGRALDWGAEGVIVPMVSSRSEAEAAVRAMRYPPRGTRSWGAVRAAALGLDEYTPQTADRAVICTVMVETREAVANAKHIASVPGVDAVLIGPSDLAVSMGIDPSAAQISTEHQELVHRVLDACDRSGALPGIVCGSASEAQRWIEAGFKMIGLPSDVDLVLQAAKNMLTDLRQSSSAGATGR